jgi:glucan phosphoethanolaminetransferase (alkaline phosphatase superfamily)
MKEKRKRKKIPSLKITNMSFFSFILFLWISFFKKNFKITNQKSKIKNQKTFEMH